MKAQQLTRLRKEDLGDGVPGWFNAVVYAFNRIVDSVDGILKNGLTVGDNHQAQIFRLRIGAGDLPYRIASSRPITDAWLTAVSEVSGSRVDFTNPVWIDWVYDASSKNLVLYNLPGLSAGKTYNLRIIALSE